MHARMRLACLPTLDGLESRVLLSRAALPQTGALVHQAAKAARRPHPNTRVNNAFNSFAADYAHAFDLYVQALGTPGANVENAKDSFEAFITQRGSLLSQQLIPVMAHVKGALGKLLPSQRGDIGNGASTPLQAFLIRRITGGANGSFSTALTPTLVKQIPPPGTTPPEAELYKLGALNAIEAARKNTFNAAGLLRSGAFTPTNKHN